MERIALTEYPGLVRQFGYETALEIICGAYAAEQMRWEFLVHVFGREIRRTVQALMNSGSARLSDYPCLAGGFAAAQAEAN